MSRHNKHPQAKPAAEAPMTPGSLLAQAILPTTKKNLQTVDKSTADSFSNFTARLGIQQSGRNLISDSYYNLGPFISRNRLELEAMYRGSWIVGQLVDCIAEDMTREGLIMHSEMKPDDIKKLGVAISTFGIWKDICSTIKWARLYGGAMAIILIDGADYTKELNIDRIRKDQFKGLVVLDRWMLQPSMGELITDICRDIGKPKYYEVLSGVSTFPEQKIHHTRVMRFDGIELPYYQKLFENLWGISVVERMLDRLIAYDSATTGAAQLLYRAYLRVIGVEGLREALAQGGKEEEAVIKQFMYIRALQNNEGITVLDAKDTFNTHQYHFAGVNKLLDEFGQQLSGATGIPLLRLFGQSPSGFSSGDNDIRSYYDRINKDQENSIRPNMDKLFGVMSQSVLGRPLPEDFSFEFAPLWQLSDTEKSTIASQDATTQSAAYGSGLITKVTALKELRQQSDITGRFTNITDEDIEDAENEPPMSEMMGGLGGDLDAGGGGAQEITEPEDPNDRLGGENPDLLDEKGSNPKVEKVSEQTTDGGVGSGVKGHIGIQRRNINELSGREIKRILLKYYEWPTPTPSTQVDRLRSFLKHAREDHPNRSEDSATSSKKLRFKDALARLRKKYFNRDADFKEEEHPRAESGEHGGEFVKAGAGGGSEISWNRNPENTKKETLKRIQEVYGGIPISERKKSTMKEIEVFDNPEDVFSRLEELGIDPEIDEGGIVRGAYDFKNKIAYVSSWNGYKESDDNFLHEFAHSIVGPSEELVDGWVNSYKNKD